MADNLVDPSWTAVDALMGYERLLIGDKHTMAEVIPGTADDALYLPTVIDVYSDLRLKIAVMVSKMFSNTASSVKRLVYETK